LKRAQSLSREHLSELTPADLTSVVGAAYTLPACQVDLVKKVVDTLLTGIYPTQTCTT
jgi:hypothetical protein